MKKVLKYGLYGFLALIVAVIVIIPLIPAGSYRGEIETRISEALAVDVSLGDIGLTSLPQPGLVVENIELSDTGSPIVSIEKLVINPRLSSLFSNRPVARRIKLTGVRLNKDQISRFTDSVDPKGTDQANIAVKKIDCAQCYLLIDKDTAFGPFEFKLLLDDDMQVSSFKLSLEEQTFKLDVTPEQKDYAIKLIAKDWVPPIAPPLKINSLQVDGLLSNLNRFHAKTIELKAYEGSIGGNLIADWKNTWSIDSRLEIQSVNLANLLREFDNASIDGLASGKFNIRAEAVYPQQLTENYKVTGDAQAVNGHIYDTDLEQAARSFSKDWSKGGQTPFDEFKAHVDIDAARVKLTALSITSSILSAEGQLDIKDQTNLDGEISVGINDTAGMISMPLMIAGTVDEPRVRPTDAALAGGAVGTAILGPGVGTAVGVKTGEFFGKVGKFFSGDDDKKDDKADKVSDDSFEDDSEL